jgi:PAS domain S-box-containing protein
MIRNYISNIVVLVVFSVGVIAIGGWFSDMENIRPLVASIASTKFNTALCLILSAIALYVVNRKESPEWLVKTGGGCASAVTIIASLTLIEYMTGVKLGIDQVFVKDMRDEVYPGRIELFACLLFLMIGIILIFLKRSKQHLLTQVLLPLVFFLSVFITFNYISGLGYLESMPFAINTALTSALSIIALCVGIFYSRPLRTLKFSFEKRIASYFAVAILLLGIVFFSFAANNQQLIRSTNLIAHTKDVLFQSALVLNAAQDIETGTRGFLITGREEFLEPFNNGVDSINGKIAEVKRLTENDAAQQRRTDTLSRLVQQNVLLRKKLIEFKRADYNEPIVATMTIGAEKKLMDSIRAMIAAIQQAEDLSLRNRNLETAQTISGAQRIITIIEILVFLTLLFLFFVIYRNAMSRNRAEAALRKSEQFIRSVIDNASISISIRDINGKYLLVNKTGQQLLGRSEKEIVGKSTADFFPETVADKAGLLDEEVINKRRLIENEVQTPGENGILYYNVVRFPLYDENDNVYAVCSLSTDITAIKEAQNAMEKTHRQQQAILNGIQDVMEASNDLICLLDESGKFVQVSGNCEQLLGYTPTELVGRPYADLLVPHELEAAKRLEEEVTNGGTLRDSLHRYYRKDGSIIALFSTVIWSPENETFFAILKDATERQLTAKQLKELNENLKKRAAELQASNVELERFAYVASHDLQEPLRMVSSFLQLLEKKLEGTLDDAGKKYIFFAIDGAERMKTLIQDLLQYSRIGTSKELMVAIDCNEVLQSVRNIFALSIKETNAELIVHPLPVIQGEKAQIHQLFQNLVGNAIKYSSPNAPHIEIGYEDQVSYWQFYVKDQGIGINPKFFEKIFVIFQRLHNKTEYSGTGIGLAICKKIVERHGGSIWVESELGKGSTFFIRLPKVNAETR